MFIHILCTALPQDRKPLASLPDPPEDDVRSMIEQAIEDMNKATKGHDVETQLGRNLLEARFKVAVTFFLVCVLAFSILLLQESLRVTWGSLIS